MRICTKITRLLLVVEAIPSCTFLCHGGESFSLFVFVQGISKKVVYLAAREVQALTSFLRINQHVWQKFKRRAIVKCHEEGQRTEIGFFYGPGWGPAIVDFPLNLTDQYLSRDAIYRRATSFQVSSFPITVTYQVPVGMYQVRDTLQEIVGLGRKHFPFLTSFSV